MTRSGVGLWRAKQVEGVMNTRSSNERSSDSESHRFAGIDLEAAIAIVLAIILLAGVGCLAVIAHMIHENPPNVPNILTPNQNIQG